MPTWQYLQANWHNWETKAGETTPVQLEVLGDLDKGTSDNAALARIVSLEEVGAKGWEIIQLFATINGAMLLLKRESPFEREDDGPNTKVYKAWLRDERKRQQTTYIPSTGYSDTSR